jgi:hypothetical protein
MDWILEKTFIFGSETPSVATATWRTISTGIISSDFFLGKKGRSLLQKKSMVLIRQSTFLGRYELTISIPYPKWEFDFPNRLRNVSKPECHFQYRTFHFICRFLTSKASRDNVIARRLLTFSHFDVFIRHVINLIFLFVARRGLLFPQRLWSVAVRRVTW